MSIYRLAILGSPPPAARTELEDALREMLGEMSLTVGPDVLFTDRISDLLPRSTEASVAAYFGSPGAADTRELLQLVRSGIPVLPVVSDLKSFSYETPPCLRDVGGLPFAPDRQKAIVRIATCLLECLGLLRYERKVFISYRRAEATEAAIQLFEALSARQFDVFLDTNDVRPGSSFQEQLWHRLCDCDVLVMLDTPTYFQSRWTYEEFGRAQAKSIAVLRVGWPGSSAPSHLRLGEDLQLLPSDLSASGHGLTPAAVGVIEAMTERLRSKSIAVRHSLLSSAFEAAVNLHGGVVHGAGAGRAVFATLKNSKDIVAVPTVGIPTSEAMHRAKTAATVAGTADVGIIYDHIGLHSQYIDHLDWLHAQISEVRGLRHSHLLWDLASW